MNPFHLLLPGLALGLASSTMAQGPVDPPPWWGVEDDVTVSLSWTFPSAFPAGQPPVQPDFEVVSPNWYSNPAPWTASSNLVWIPNLNGHQGVLGLVGNGNPQQASLKLFVDNDPHIDWVKIFWFQFDQFQGASGDVTQNIAEQLNKYGRAAVTEKVEALAGGWERVTVSAELIPQPDDEDIEFLFLEDLLGTAAIDNLHVSSKCVKPRPDEDGEPLGKLMTQSIPLTLATFGRTCKAVAVTRGNATSPGRRLWVATNGINQSTPHEILELDNAGVATGNVVPLGSTSVQTPLGPMDMAVERIRQAGGTFQEIIYVLLRETSGDLRIEAYDANNNGAPIPAPTRTFNIPAAISQFLANERLGLVYDPSGENGRGTFWISGRVNVAGSPWRRLEITRPRVVPTPVGPQLIDSQTVPTGTVGMAYDDTFGNFYCFSSEPVLKPSGVPVLVNGIEISGFTNEPTGVRFCGDVQLPNPGGAPGGTAAGMTLYRTFDGPRSELRFACVAETAQGQFYYEVAGPFRYGYSRYGTCGMQNGPPFLGGSFDITLQGVPNTLLSMLFLGSSSANIPLGPGIQSEAVASLIPDVSSAFVSPVSSGQFRVSVSLPNTTTLSYVETFWQWAVLDTTAPGFLGFSQAGKTVVYP